MATITEVQSDQHRYLVFDAVALSEGEGIHSVTNATEDGSEFETTIVRTAEGVNIKQIGGGENHEEDWTLAQVAQYAAGARLFSPNPELISVSDEFIEENLEAEDFAEYQRRLANPEPEFDPLAALMAALASGEFESMGMDDEEDVA